MQQQFSQQREMGCQMWQRLSSLRAELRGDYRPFDAKRALCEGWDL